MDESPAPTSKPLRLRRLCLGLACLVLLWAIVTAVRAWMPPSRLTLARQAVEMGHFDAAINHYLEHLARRPDDWGVRLELGVVLREVDQPQALIEFRKVPPEAEERIEALRQIVAICLATERFRDAEEALLEWNRKAPDDGDAPLMLAELYFRRGQAKAALPYAQTAADRNPQTPRAHFLLAEVLDELNRPGEMIDPLHRVLALDPDSYAAHLNLSYAYAEAGQSEPSRHHAQWCLERNPADVSARRFLALALRDRGEPEKALQEIELALKTSPHDLACRLLEAELLLFLRQPDEALKRLQPFYPQHPNDRRVPALLSRAAAAAGKPEEAAEYQQRVQKLSER